METEGRVQMGWMGLEDSDMVLEQGEWGSRAWLKIKQVRPLAGQWETSGRTHDKRDEQINR